MKSEAGVPRVTTVVDPEALRGESVEIVGTTYQHLFRARRLAAGASLRLVDGSGTARWGRVESVRRRDATVSLGEPAPLGDSHRRLTLVVAPPRSQRSSWLVEKATELGVRRLLFVASERAAREPGEAWLQRLRRIAVAALEQCHGATLPILEGPVPLEQVLAEVAREEIPHRAFLHPTASLPGGDPLAPGFEDVVCAIGPEGGWARSEIDALRAATFAAVALGPRILRIETAALAAAALALRPPFAEQA